MTTDKITLDNIWKKLQATNILDKENKYIQDDIKRADAAVFYQKCRCI